MQQFQMAFSFRAALCLSFEKCQHSALSAGEPPTQCPKVGKKFCRGYKMRQGLYKLSAGSCSSGTSDSLTPVVRPKTRDNSGYK